MHTAVEWSIGIGAIILFFCGIILLVGALVASQSILVPALMCAIGAVIIWAWEKYEW